MPKRPRKSLVPTSRIAPERSELATRLGALADGSEEPVHLVLRETDAVVLDEQGR